MVAGYVGCTVRGSGQARGSAASSAKPLLD